MRSGTIIAVLVALAVLVFGVMWYNSGDPDAIVTRETDELIPDEAAVPEGDAGAIGATTEAAEGTAAEDDGPIVVGDEITEDTITVQSATEDPVILDPDEVTSSVEVIGDDGAVSDQSDVAVAGDATTDGEPVVAGDATTEGEPPVAGDATTEGEPLVAGDAGAEGEPLVAGDTGAEGEPLVAGDTSTEGEPLIADDATIIEGGEQEAAAGEEQQAGSAASDPEEILSPSNFDPDEVIALIDGSDELSSEQRSSLRALVNGASTNPAMVESAVESIRTALNLPPLE